jgi:hypothetical protein
MGIARILIQNRTASEVDFISFQNTTSEKERKRLTNNGSHFVFF